MHRQGRFDSHVFIRVGKIKGIGVGEGEGVDKK